MTAFVRSTGIDNSGDEASIASELPGRRLPPSRICSFGADGRASWPQALILGFALVYQPPSVSEPTAARTADEL